ncbi:MAG: MarR family transcriptional regulator [bacterium]|nr:MarR family transcriptional regulator [bacterium]
MGGDKLMAGPIRPRGPRPSSEMVDRAATLTRQQRRILEELHLHPAGLTVREISDSVGLHSNTVRGHVDVLEERELVAVVIRPSSGPGRPSRVYVAQSAHPGRPTAHLAALIRVAVGTMEPGRSIEQAREWGRNWAESMIATNALPPGTDVVAVTTALMSEMGFAPVADDSTVRLYRCPLLAPDGTIPPEVCSIHEGMIAAVASEIGGRRNLSITPVLGRFDGPISCSVRFESRRASEAEAETAPEGAGPEGPEEAAPEGAPPDRAPQGPGPQAAGDSGPTPTSGG